MAGHFCSLWKPQKPHQEQMRLKKASCQGGEADETPESLRQRWEAEDASLSTGRSHGRQTRIFQETHRVTIQYSADSADMQSSAQEAPQQTLVRSRSPGIPR